MNLRISHIAYLITLSIILLCPFYSQGQANHVNPVNNYIIHANESTHGMLIAHRILEGLNQKVNAFVDLQSNQLNFYGNKDLPKDLFEDAEHWFYDISPNSLYSIAKTTPWTSTVKGDLDAIALEMHLICQEVNQMRFKMEKFINDNDLQKTEHQVKIFEQLNFCASLYDRYYEANDRLHTTINTLLDSEQNPSAQKVNYRHIQQTIKTLLEIIHYGFDDELMTAINALQEHNGILQKATIRDQRLLDMKNAINEALVIVNDYKNNKDIPERYNLYGSAYYYHNVQLVSILNRYGKGFVSNANKLLHAEDPNQVLLIEEPHYFKIVLPKKEIPLAKPETAIKKLPSRLEERDVIISQTKIQFKERKVLIEIFDHRQEDGDIISLNFNGKWILKEKKLKKIPLKLILELNEEGENYLLLHAENLGDTPPNTIAVRYYLDGQRKLVVLNSDLNQSEMIRFEKVQPE